MAVNTITPQTLHELMKKGGDIDFIDVRTPAEYREVHAQGVRSVPLDLLDPQAVMKQRTAVATSPLYVICRSGSRGEQACNKFAAAGFTNVVNVAGGTLAWESAGLPVDRARGGSCVIALDRQMRMVAGSLVIVGCAVAWWVHPLGLALAAFVGAGLVFSGATNICPMLGALSKMPWNR